MDAWRATTLGVAQSMRERRLQSMLQSGKCLGGGGIKAKVVSQLLKRLYVFMHIFCYNLSLHLLEFYTALCTSEVHP